MTQVLKRSKTGVSLVLTDLERFQVIFEDDCLVETKVLSYAEIAYQEAVEERSSKTEELRKREKAHYEMQAVRSDSFARRTANANKKGGPGGRGGV